MKADMQDNENTVVEKAKFGNRRTRVVAAALGLVFLCGVMALIATHDGPQPH
jgi:hypothetical protein